MSRLKNRDRWVNVGFELFASEGPAGIQVERLARILDLNKSGFYHYFGTPENYLHVLMRHLLKQSDLVVSDTRMCKVFDPEFLQVMVTHKPTILATVQLASNRHISLLNETRLEVTKKIDAALLPLWAAHIGVANNPGLALRYFEMIRDMFFSRVTHETLDYDYLHSLADEARTIIFDLNRHQV